MAGSVDITVPLLLLIPLVTFVLLSFGVRTRRGAAAVNLIGTLLALAAALWVAAVRLHERATYLRALQWINIPTATSGPTRFQGFGIDLDLSVDHAGLAALITVLAIATGVSLWSRRGARDEPGYVRGYTLLALLTFGAAGLCLSGDLAELAFFWGLTGVTTYLLLAHRWGDEASTGAARRALALPMVADVALLCAVGLIYARYGDLTMSRLPHALAHTPGVGLKTVTAVAFLLLVAAAGRAALFPLQGWITGTAGSPPASWAAAQGVWAALAALLLYRMLPVFDAAGPQSLAAVGVAGLAAGILLPIRGLAGNDLRVVVAGAGIGQMGLVLVVFARGVPSLGLTAALAGGLARTAAVLAASGVIAAMRTVNLAEMGGGWRRMRWSALSLAAAVLALAGAGGQAAALGLRSGPVTAAYGAGMALVALCALRAYAGAAHGPLRRRRAFEPDRVREVTASMAVAAAGLAVLALVGAVLTFSTRWLNLLDTHPHAHPAASGTALWLAVPAAGLAASGAWYGWRRSRADAVSAGAGRTLNGLVAAGQGWAARILGERLASLPERADGLVAAGGEHSLGRSLLGTGRWLEALPALLPALAGLAVVAAVVVGALSPGWVR